MAPLVDLHSTRRSSPRKRRRSPRRRCARWNLPKPSPKGDRSSRRTCVLVGEPRASRGRNGLSDANPHRIGKCLARVVSNLPAEVGPGQREIEFTAFGSCPAPFGEKTFTGFFHAAVAIGHLAA